MIGLTSEITDEVSFRPTGPPFTCLSTDKANMIKCPALGAQAGIQNRQRNDSRITKR